VGPEHGDPNPCEMKAIGEEDQGESSEMVDNEFEKVLPWFFQLKR